jgi:hypothetical protein
MPGLPQHTRSWCYPRWPTERLPNGDGLPCPPIATEGQIGAIYGGLDVPDWTCHKLGCPISRPILARCGKPTDLNTHRRGIPHLPTKTVGRYGAPFFAGYQYALSGAERRSTHAVVVSHISQQNRWEIWGATCATRQNHYQYALSWSGRDDASSAKLLHLKQRGAACIQRDRVVG